ncbi:MAG: insulinase family protein [Candidatus Krumholzibacteria bacterium]|nr:insulinase family protein [Candidatus Krumholzibacteria bacterium]
MPKTISPKIMALTGLLFCLQAAVVLASSSSPDENAVPSPAHPTLFDQVEEFRLDNGMLFLLLPRHDVPMISGSIVVKVGNVDNPAGATGLAHMFEHMAFKGTDYIGTRDAVGEKAVGDSITVAGVELSDLLRDGAPADSVRIAELRSELGRLGKRESEFVIPMEFPRVYGGYTYDFNAYTSQDFTVYQATLPANNLEVWMLMESERLQNPVFREFYAELEVVKEERHQNTDDNPEGMARELLKSLAFGEHPYRYPTIGYMEDLETLNPGQIDDFWREYYVPGNMVAALIGDFDLDEAETMIKNYFGDIPSRPTPAGPGTPELEQKEQKRGTHRQGAERRLLMAFPGFAPNDPRRPAADLLSSMLSRGKTSRLDRRLDLEEGVARAIYTSSTGGYRRYPGLFTITVDLMADATNQMVEDLIWQELEKLQTEPIKQEKLDEIRASYRKGFIFQLQKNSDLVEILAMTQASQGDWRRAYRRFNDHDRVTVEEITSLAHELFVRDKASVVYLEPEVPELPIDETEGDRP